LDGRSLVVGIDWLSGDGLKTNSAIEVKILPLQGVRCHLYAEQYNIEHATSQSFMQSYIEESCVK